MSNGNKDKISWIEERDLSLFGNLEIMKTDLKLTHHAKISFYTMDDNKAIFFWFSIISDWDVYVFSESN